MKLEASPGFMPILMLSDSEKAQRGLRTNLKRASILAYTFVREGFVSLPAAVLALSAYVASETGKVATIYPGAIVPALPGATDAFLAGSLLATGYIIWDVIRLGKYWLRRPKNIRYN